MFDRDRAQDAQVAQLVEHATENRSVGGSIPPLGTIVADEAAVRGIAAGDDPEAQRRAPANSIFSLPIIIDDLAPIRLSPPDERGIGASTETREIRRHRADRVGRSGAHRSEQLPSAGL